MRILPVPCCCGDVRIREKEPAGQSSAAGADVHSAADLLCGAVLCRSARGTASEVPQEGYCGTEHDHPCQKFAPVPGDCRCDLPGAASGFFGPGHLPADRTAGAVCNLRHSETVE